MEALMTSKSVLMTLTFSQDFMKILITHKVRSELMRKEKLATSMN
jgi:hypothetical protein